MQTYAYLLPENNSGSRAISRLDPVPDGVKIGVDLYTPEYAANMVNVTSATPKPDVGWLTVDGGKTFTPPPEPETTTSVPFSVSSAQAKIQCLRSPGAEDGETLLDNITAKVQSAGGETQIWFTEARTWERDNPYVASLSSGLGLTAQQVDHLFIEAAQIKA